MEEIIKNAQNGDEEALNTVIGEIESPLYKIAILRLKNEEDAKDVVQETMLIIYKNIKNLKETKYFKTWATKILINECNKYYKVKSRTIEVADNINNPTDFEIEIDEVTQKLDSIKILDSLKTKDKNIIVLHINGYKNSEIAEIMEMNENTVKTKIRRCKDKIQKEYVFNKEDGTITPRTKAIKTVLMSLLIIVLTTGLVYASIIVTKNIQDRLKEAEPVKLERYNITINATNEELMTNMKQYDENTYLLSIKDGNSFNQIKDRLSIKFQEEQEITGELLEKHELDIILIVIKNQKNVQLYNVSPLDDEVIIQFTFDDNSESNDTMEFKAYCIAISKKHNRENIVLKYEKKQQEKPPKNAVYFKYGEFYIENIEKFDEQKFKYDNEQDVYYTEFLNQNSYNKLKEDLGIITTNNINIDLTGKDIALVFKKTNNKLDFYRFKVKEEIPYIYVREEEEECGVGITGVLVGLDEGIYDEFKVELIK